jgi:hypothetical protein
VTLFILDGPLVANLAMRNSNAVLRKRFEPRYDDRQTMLLANAAEEIQSGDDDHKSS